MRRFKLFLTLAALLLPAFAHADTIVWRSPTKPLTIGLSTTDYTQVMFPEPIAAVVVEDPSYIDGKPLDGYNGRAIMFQSLLPKMATRAFFTGQSGNTYVVILTTDVPYRTYLEIVDGVALKQTQQSVASKMGPLDMVRAMAQDADVPGITRETYVIPNWFRGSGMTFDLSEVWQSPTMTGLVVHVRNENPQPNEVNLPAIVIPKTTEWGNLRFASMENLRLAPVGQPNDKGVLFLVFIR
ncbi:MAG: hypothetical protein DI585_04450 [Pseudomonas fluorescens]|nr:MAG: hypothetical protein DI585_04450 [Pseudomonas fluorescens]